jgi:hypothetical protein
VWDERLPAPVVVLVLGPVFYRRRRLWWGSSAAGAGEQRRSVHVNNGNRCWARFACSRRAPRPARTLVHATLLLALTPPPLPPKKKKEGDTQGRRSSREFKAFHFYGSNNRLCHWRPAAVTMKTKKTRRNNVPPQQNTPAADEGGRRVREEVISRRLTMCMWTTVIMIYKIYDI